MEAIGLLAGAGRLPLELAKAAKSIGIKIFAVALLNETDTELENTVEKFARINIAKLDEIILFFKNNNINKVTMLGKVTKELLFTGQHEQMDARLIKLLMTVKDKSDDTLMLAFVKELASEGIETLDQTALLKTFMPGAGVFTYRQPSDEEKADAEFGFKIAKKLGNIDVGQTVVVKDQAVMALEAIEGTDACILRGGKLAGKDAVVIKTAKPGQDNRFDVPAIGVKTIKSMIEAKANVLAFEAGSTFIVDKEQVLALANENKITIIAI